MLKSKEDIDNKFVELGKKCLKRCYIAYNENDILEFIDNVIIKNQDPLEESRRNFAQEDLMLNYPNVSKNILDYINNLISLADS